MSDDLRSIHDFLADRHPFDQLPAETVDALPEQLEQRQLSPGETILRPDEPNPYLYIIRSGCVEIHDSDGSLLARLGAGDIFGQRSLLGDGTADTNVRTIEETLLYCLPAALFHQLCRDYPQFQYFFAPFGGGRLRGALQSLGGGDNASVNLMTIPVADIVTREAVTLPGAATIREAAQTMSRQGISSLMVMEDGALSGIVTDRDMRNRVIAPGLSPERPVREIMTASPATIDIHGYAYEALLAMARNSFHHLPVMDGDRIVGMVTDTDLVRRYSTSPLYLVSTIYKCRDSECLAQAGQESTRMLLTLVEANASAQNIGHVISSIGEAITCRLLTLAEERLGPSPVPYAWVVGGSQARYEQTAHTDQDNCLLLSDDYQPEQHEGYFEALSRFVCDGLNACGYIYCPGEIMAMTPRWRQPLAVWKRYFSGWIEQPKPEALVNATVFFDLRWLYGEKALFDELQAYYLVKARANRIFQAYLAANALQFQPPLGFFGNLVLIKGGEHDHTLDLKHNGVVPIIDLARVYALSAGVPAVNTTDRLTEAAEHTALSQGGAADLRDAFDFIGSIRLRHQARQVKNGLAPDNYVSPKDLSHFERNHLKDAFVLVRTMQSALGQRFQAGRFG